MTRTALALACLAAGCALAQPAKESARCTGAEQRQLDFWLGDWDVRSGDEIVATSRIELASGGCVVREGYAQKDGYSGTSLSFHDPVTGKWRQTWVDSTGSVGEFIGEFRDGAMRFTGETHRADGTRIYRKMALSREGDAVRQASEASRDGASWSHTTTSPTAAKGGSALIAGCRTLPTYWMFACEHSGPIFREGAHPTRPQRNCPSRAVEPAT
jgi:hypothetical protein